MDQSQALSIVNDQLERFKNGQISCTQMWDEIESELAEMLPEEPALT